MRCAPLGGQTGMPCARLRPDAALGRTPERITPLLCPRQQRAHHRKPKFSPGLDAGSLPLRLASHTRTSAWEWWFPLLFSNPYLPFRPCPQALLPVTLSPKAALDAHSLESCWDPPQADTVFPPLSPLAPLLVAGERGAQLVPWLSVPLGQLLSAFIEELIKTPGDPDSAGGVQ